MMRKVLGGMIFFMLLLSSTQSVHADPRATWTDSLQIRFRFYFGEQPITLKESHYNIADTIDIQFETFRFYISNIQLLYSGKVMHTVGNAYQLIDVSKPISEQVLAALPDGVEFDQIRFHVGVDSVTSVSGAMEGELDPLNGMYWTWQSGYINIKLEGFLKTPSIEDEKFHFHIGGYRSPNNAFTTVDIMIPNAQNRNNLSLGLDLRPLLESGDILQKHQIMSPGPDAVSFARQFAGLFKIISP